MNRCLVAIAAAAFVVLFSAPTPAGEDCDCESAAEITTTTMLTEHCVLVANGGFLFGNGVSWTYCFEGQPDGDGILDCVDGLAMADAPTSGCYAVAATVEFPVFYHLSFDGGCTITLQEPTPTPSPTPTPTPSPTPSPTPTPIAGVAFVHAGGQFRSLDVSWTADAAGATSGSLEMLSRLNRWVSVPSAAAGVYNLRIYDYSGYDLLAGAGAGLTTGTLTGGDVDRVVRGRINVAVDGAEPHSTGAVHLFFEGR